MNKIKTMVELLSYKNQLIKQSQEIQSKLTPIQENINSLNDQIFMSKELHDFFCEKILSTYTKDELDEVDKYRKALSYAAEHQTITSYNGYKIFDPFNDSWYIYDYEQEGDNIRFLVSCRKNEGSISGLMTFLDTHSTDWIKINELEKFNTD